MPSSANRDHREQVRLRNMANGFMDNGCSTCLELESDRPHLNMLSYKDHLDSIVSDFIYLPWKFAQDQANKRTNLTDDDSDSCTPSVTTAAAEIFHSCMTEYLREQITKTNLLKIIKVREFSSEAEFKRSSFSFASCSRR
ncbi:hypothetical protein Tco_1051545 [Tanacetum coccineum]